jgi:hypothetical protein
LLERALVIQETQYGPHHPEIAIALTNLVVAYHDLEQPKIALQTAQRAYQILMFHPLYGAAHPKTQRCLKILQSTCRLTLADLQGIQEVVATFPPTPVAAPGTAGFFHPSELTGAATAAPAAKPLEARPTAPTKKPPHIPYSNLGDDSEKRSCVMS